jgi:hypothetical protein
VQFHVAALDHHDGSHGDDRLGHRCKAKQGILRHRTGFGLIEEAVRLEVEKLSVPRDHRHGTGKYATVDLSFHDRRDARQPLARHPLHFAFIGLAVRRLCGLLCN